LTRIPPVKQKPLCPIELAATPNRRTTTLFRGRLGESAHKAGVVKAEAKARVDFQGQKVETGTEGRVNTPGGHKNTRYGDLVVTKGGKQGKAYQVGDVLKDGKTPVSRERKALKDIRNQGVDTEFIPKEK
jgi:hypothetical protein